jgi:hypothetical protein
VLAPIAWLGSITSDPHGVVVGRVAFMALGAANAVLVAVLCRRFGRSAALAAGVGYALYFPAAYSERTMLLEPVGSTAVLLTLLLATGRRSRVATVLGGVAIGLAVATKIWYVVPLAAIGAAIPGRRRLWFAAGAAASVLLVVGPFFLASPNGFVRQVVLDQLGRPEATGWPIDRRLESMLGLGTPALMAPQVASMMPLKLALLGTAVLLLAALALTVRGARVFVALAAGAVVVLLLTPSYFSHYDALLGPPLALTVGVGVGRLATLLRHRTLQVVLVAGVLAALVLVYRHIDTVRTSSPIPATALRPAAAQVAGCVTGDEPFVLAELNVLSRDFARGCPVWVDVTGYTYDRDREGIRGSAVSRPLNRRWQRDITRYLLSGDAVIVHRAATGLGPSAQQALRRQAVLARSGNWVLREVAPVPRG